MTSTVNTKAASRRQLRYENLQSLRLDVDRISDAAQRGMLRTTGNWTPAQILTHVSAWIDYGWEGYPVKPPPFFVRWVLKRMLPGMLRKGMKPGVQIPGVKGGTTGAEDIPLPEAIERLRSSIRRLESGEPEKFPSPAFGSLSQQDRVQLMLRHAELHLSFLSFE